MSALKYLQSNNQNLDTSKTISQNIFGLDINRSIARIAKMKLLLIKRMLLIGEGQRQRIFC